MPIYFYKMSFRVIICFVFLCGTIEGMLAVEVQAEGVIVIDGISGSILYEKRGRESFYPASITKIATAWMAMKMMGETLDTRVAVEGGTVAALSSEAKRRRGYRLPAYWLEPDATHIGLKGGEELTMRELLYGLLVASGNDAANAIAHHFARDIPRFMEHLNRCLQLIGCQATHFMNPHGLHHPDHYTTAYDMALMTKEALKLSLFRDIVRAKSFERPTTPYSQGRKFNQTNKLLLAGEFFYPYAIGVKTGYTAAARHTLVAAAEKEGRLLIAVLLKGDKRSDLFKDAIRLFESAFNEPLMSKVILQAGKQPFTLNIEGGAFPLATYIDEPLIARYYPSEDPRYTCTVAWKDLDHDDLPLAAGTPVGEVRFHRGDGALALKATLRAERDLPRARSKWTEWTFWTEWIGCRVSVSIL